MANKQTKISDAEAMEEYHKGKSGAKIGREKGVSRQAVWQHLTRLGYKGHNNRGKPDREKFIAALQNSSTLKEVEIELNLTEKQIQRTANDYDATQLLKNAKSRWRANKSEKYYLSQQRPFINQIRELAVKLGHTPRQEDLQSIGISPMTLHRTFNGGVPAAMIASGLVPNRGRNKSPLPEDFINLNISATNIDEVLQRANLLRLLDGNIPEPEGVKEPKQKTVTTSVYYRDTRVVAWVLQYADGICELCSEQGYETDAGIAYLEIHHVIPLSEGGPDMITNAVAICETCHGKLHRAKNRNELKKNLYRNVTRLLSIGAF